MADVKKVLVVDDHFEMLELLRSMLELSNEECEVLAVPSAEEGMLELRRTQFDLVITDVRLPGMSGFDFVRRIRRVKPETPVIMITAYSSSEGQKEADELGVIRYFSKPLDTDAVLMTVQVALHGDPPPPPDGVEEIVEDTAVSDEVVKRLKTLRTDTGASGLMLSSLSGQMIFQASGDQTLDLPALSSEIANTIQNSFSLANYLDSEVPNTIQYHSGDKVEIYCANIGRSYFLTIFFDVQSRRGRIGTIWVFTQRAIKDLVELLPDGEQPILNPAVDPAVSQVVAEVIEVEEQHVPESEPEPEPEPEEETTVVEDFIDFDASDLDDLFGDSDLAEGSLKVDDFWDDAMTEHETPKAGGLSLEEARKQGLIPSDMDLDNAED